VKVEGLSTQYPKLSNYVHGGNFVQHKTLSHWRQKGIVQQNTLLSNISQKLLSNRRQMLLSNRRQMLTQSLTLSPKSISSNTHLIKRGSQTACNCKLDYHESCTLCRDLYPVSTSSDFITFRWLENLHVAMLTEHEHTSVVWGKEITTCLYKG
jgi:hypothetical protein